MKIKMLLIMALAVCLSSSMAIADTLIKVPATNSFATFTANESGTEYFSNVSQDGAEANIGYFLTGDTTYYNGSNPPMRPNPLSPALTNPMYLQQTAGNADFYFQSTAGSAISLLIEVAGNRNGNRFGWYDQTTGTRTELFTGAAGPGASTVLTLLTGTKFGFYLQTPTNQFFYSEASKDTAGLTTLSHFALFKGDNYPNTYFIGIEDLPQPNTNEGSFGDFNDMALRVRAVPIPGALLLLGAGMARLVAYARRRQDS